MSGLVYQGKRRKKPIKVARYVPTVTAELTEVACAETIPAMSSSLTAPEPLSKAAYQVESTVWRAAWPPHSPHVYGESSYHTQ